MSSAAVTELTFRMERRRAIATGVLETASVTFLLLIAMRWFHAGATAKALVTAGGSLGLIATPFTVWIVARLGWPATRAAAWLGRVGAGGYALAALAAVFGPPALPAYVASVTLAMTATFAMIPLLTQMYQDNYPGGERGSRFSQTVIIRIIMSMVFSWAAGRLLTDHDDRAPYLLLVYAVAFWFAAGCIARIPASPVTREGGAHLFRSWKYVREDTVFRNTLASWMLMGIGNLMMLPLRIEYLGNPKYGLAMPAATIALLTGVLPNVTRLLMIAVWGRLFDRMDFFMMRAILNIGFALNILLFFGGDSMAWQVAASVVFGVAAAGGDIAWSLWVTKIAPPRRTADYMAAHTFLNGLRSAVAPFLAFWFVETRPIGQLAWICTGLIVLATLVLIPEMRVSRGVGGRIRSLVGLRPRIPPDARSE